MLSSTISPAPAGVIWPSATTATAPTDAFSAGQIAATLHALAGVVAEYDQELTQLRHHMPNDQAQVASLRQQRDQAERLLFLHARRLLPRVLPGADELACLAVAAALVARARQKVVSPYRS